MITEADVTEFQGLYEKQFGKPIAKEAAFQKLTLLVRQMEIVYQPIRKQINEDGDENGRADTTNQCI